MVFPSTPPLYVSLLGGSYLKHLHDTIFTVCLCTFLVFQLTRTSKSFNISQFLCASLMCVFYQEISSVFFVCFCFNRFLHCEVFVNQRELHLVPSFLYVHKDHCESQNVSIQYPCALLVYLCFLSEDLFIFSV